MFRYLFVSEFRHRVAQLAELGFVPVNIGQLVTQQYRGDVTIVPSLTVVDYVNLLSNPTSKSIERFTYAGCNNTYPSKKREKEESN
jgi:hypothetical protein